MIAKSDKHVENKTGEVRDLGISVPCQLGEERSWASEEIGLYHLYTVYTGSYITVNSLLGGV